MSCNGNCNQGRACDCSDAPENLRASQETTIALIGAGLGFVFLLALVVLAICMGGM